MALVPTVELKVLVFASTTPSLYVLIVVPFHVAVRYVHVLVETVAALVNVTRDPGVPVDSWNSNVPVVLMLNP